MKTRLEEIYNHLNAAYDLLLHLPKEELPELCEACVDINETPNELERKILLCSSLVLCAALKQH